MKAYPQGIFFSSVAEVSDLINMKEMLSTRKGHEELTTQVGKFLQQEGYEIFILSTGILRSLRNLCVSGRETLPVSRKDASLS